MMLLLSAGNLTCLASDPCSVDAARFCPTTVGPHAWDTCMRMHMSLLTQSCRAHLLSVSDIQSDSCDRDIIKFCLQVKPGNLRRLGCLNEKMSSVSSPCRSTLSKISVCRKPIDEFCQTKDMPVSDLKFCLFENRADIGSKCGSEFNIAMEYDTICAQDVSKFRCDAMKVNRHGNLTDCIVNNMDKMSKQCLKSWIRQHLKSPLPIRKVQIKQARKYLEKK